MKSTTVITTLVLLGILAGPSLGMDKLVRAFNNLFNANENPQDLGRYPVSYFAYPLLMRVLYFF